MIWKYNKNYSRIFDERVGREYQMRTHKFAKLHRVLMEKQTKFFRDRAYSHWINHSFLFRINFFPYIRFVLFFKKLFAFRNAS